MVVILAAGKGSRMLRPDQSENTSKCAIDIHKDLGKPPETTVTRLIKQFYDAGERDFIIVVGHGVKSITDTVSKYIEKVKLKNGRYKYSDLNINYIYNPHYEGYGCEYSLSLIGQFVNENYDLIIVEGDLITSSANITDVVSSSCSGVLTRPSIFASKKSVIVPLHHQDKVSEFVYDPNHETNFIEWSGLLNFKESMQIWIFKAHSEVLKSLVSYLKDYKRSVDEMVDTKDSVYVNNEYRNMSGLWSINKSIISCDFKAIHSLKCKEWMNLNTVEDLNKLKEEEWFV